MTDPKRILIIDDEVGVRVESDLLFKNAGFESEVCIAHDLAEAMNKLKEWAQSGHPADIVDSDYYLPLTANLESIPELRKFKNDASRGGINGVSVMSYIMHWADQQPENLRPIKYFMHSNASIGGLTPNQKEKIEIHHPEEFFSIAAMGEGQPLLGRGYDNLRSYLNKTFGANYPTTEAQLALLENPDNAKLGIAEAYYEVKDSGLNQETALRCMEVHDLEGSFEDRLSCDVKDDITYHGEKYPQFERTIGSAMVGTLAFSAEKAREFKKQGKKVILVLDDFIPEDTKLLGVTDGIILLGNETEHLAIVVANHNISALMGAEEYDKLKIDTVDGKKRITNDKTEFYEADHFVYEEGEEVTIGGGVIGKGALAIEKHEIANDDSVYGSVVRWADEARKKYNGTAIKANADTPEQIKHAIELKAEGIGLLRTEHMFFAEDRLKALQTALTSENGTAALTELKEFQKQDFTEIFHAAAECQHDFPITIRLLDAPPEEFLSAEQIEALEARVGKQNTRGAQLAAHTPSLYAMQAEAIFEAARETEYKGQLDVMIPLIRTPEELGAIKEEISAVAERQGMTGHYKLRAMVETLEAVKNAAAIAPMVDGISFGTNDLTAEAMGNIKRDDIATTRTWMAKNNHVGKSPFLTLSKPVIALMQETVKAARAANPNIDIGICGHQVTGDQPSIVQCQKLGLDSLSVPAGAQYFMPTKIISGQAALHHSLSQNSETKPSAKSFADRNPKRDPFEADGTGWSRGKDEA